MLAARRTRLRGLGVWFISPFKVPKRALQLTL
jgi:hypothetical protein